MPGSAVVTINEKEWEVDVAASADELSAGLGGVVSIPANTGMLFDLGGPQTVEVTTEPMLFNIDIIFIKETVGITDFVWKTGEVVDVVRDVAPGYMVTEETPVRFFLEVNAGEAEGIEAGDSVEITDYEYMPPSGISQWMPMIISVAALGFVGAMVGGMARVAFAPEDAAYSRKYLPAGVSPPGRLGLGSHSPRTPRTYEDGEKLGNAIKSREPSSTEKVDKALRFIKLQYDWPQPGDPSVEYKHWLIDKAKELKILGLRE